MGFPVTKHREIFSILEKTNHYKKFYMLSAYFFNLLNTIIAKNWIFFSMQVPYSLFCLSEKLFKKKLMHSFMALMLIIKMIKVKLMFLLPMIVGQSTAKKLLLKVLLFLIPGLAHLFKLCHYYHLEHAKYHHHHHKVSLKFFGWH